MKAISAFSFVLTLVILLGFSHRSSRQDPSLPDLSDTLYKGILVNPDAEGIFSLSDIADSIWMTPLATNPDGLLTSPQKILIDNNKFFMMENEQEEAVFCYSIEGDFLFKIDRKGRGPGEYSLLGDFTLDRANKKLILSDRNSQTLLLFDYNGQYEKTIKTELYFEFLAYLEGTRLLLLTQYQPNPKLPPNKHKQVLIYDYEKNEVVDGYLQFDGDKDTFLNLVGPLNGFSESATKTYFIIPGENSIWTMTEGGISEFLNISFGKKAFPNGYLDKYTYGKQRQLIDNGACASELVNFQIAGNWLIGIYNYMESSPVIFFNYRTGQFFSTRKMIKNDIGDFPVVAMPPFHTDGKTLITAMSSELISVLAANPKAKALIPPELSSIEDGDAPILQFIRLK